MTCFVFGLLASCAHGTEIEPSRQVVGMVRDLDGSSRALGALHGRPALIFVFATWSDPALLDVPRLAQAHARFGDRLQFLGVALDEQLPAVRVFVDTFQPPFPVVVPDDRGQFVGPRGPLGPLSMVPTTALLSSSGEVFGIVEGGWPSGALHPAIERLLAADRATR